MKTDPFFNLAAEEYLLTQLDCEQHDHVFIYVNKPAVVVGRNQNIYEEVNLAYCHKNNINVCRRISGGGTVYHDEGNINIAWFSKSEMSKVNNYTNFMDPVIGFLKSYEIDAYLNKRNSLMTGDKKIGGNAQFTTKKNLLSHCTLLFNTDLNHLENAISPSFKHVSSHAGKSVRSNVINLKEKLDPSLTIKEFIDSMKIYFVKHGVQTRILNDKSTATIEQKHVPKLKSFDWVYGRSPKCIITINIDNKDYTLTVYKGIIEEVSGIDVPTYIQLLIGTSLVFTDNNILFNL